MITPRWVDTRSQPIAVGDIVTALADLAERDEAPKEVELGGADVLTYREMMRRLAMVMGRRPASMLGVPVLSPRLSSYWVALITQVELGSPRRWSTACAARWSCATLRRRVSTSTPWASSRRRESRWTTGEVARGHRVGRCGGARCGGGRRVAAVAAQPAAGPRQGGDRGSRGVDGDRGGCRARCRPPS